NYVYSIRISEHLLSQYFFANRLVLNAVQDEEKGKKTEKEEKTDKENELEKEKKNLDVKDQEISSYIKTNDIILSNIIIDKKEKKKKSDAKQILPFYIWRFFLKNIQFNVKDENVLNTLLPVNIIKIINGLIFYKIMDKKFIEIIMTRIENEYSSKGFHINTTRNRNNKYNNNKKKNNSELTHNIHVDNKSIEIKKNNNNMCKTIRSSDKYSVKKEKEKFNFICLNTLLNYMSHTNDIQYYNIKIDLIKMIKNIIFKEEK
ncbi:hypothetical protein PGSY75_0001700A, partial [Plasmodium gaboni]